MGNTTPGPTPPKPASTGTAAPTQSASVKPASGTPPVAQNCPGTICPKTAPAPAPVSGDKAWYEQVWDGMKKGGTEDVRDDLGEPPSPDDKPSGGWEYLGYGVYGAMKGRAEGRAGPGRVSGIGKGRAPKSTPGKAPAPKDKPAEPAAATPAAANGNGGGFSKGGAAKGDCDVKPYKDQKCPPGQQAHHIVPDYALRYGTRGEGAKGEKRIPGMPSLDDGPSICLSGGSKEKGSEHNKGHEGTDPRIKKEGQRTKNGPIGAAPIGDIVDISIEEVSKVKPHCADEVKKKTNEAFKDVDRTKYGRTTQMPPKAGTDAHGSLSRGSVHTSNTPKPRGRKQ